MCRALSTNPGSTERQRPLSQVDKLENNPLMLKAVAIQGRTNIARKDHFLTQSYKINYTFIQPTMRTKLVGRSS